MKIYFIQVGTLYCALQNILTLRYQLSHPQITEYCLLYSVVASAYAQLLCEDDLINYAISNRHSLVSALA